MCQVWDEPLQTHTQKLVLLALADNANDDGVCWPSMRTIARKCDLSEQAVRNQVAALQDLQLISVEVGGGRKSNTYRLSFKAEKKPTNLPPNGVEGSTGLRSPPNGVEGHPPTALSPPPNGVEPNRNKPSNEPSVNQKGAVAPAEKSNPTSRKRELTDSWCAAFQSQFRRRYLFQGAKDGKAADKLLTLGMSVSELVAAAQEAWKRPDEFNCKQAVSLAGFACRFNEICAVIYPQPTAPPRPNGSCYDPALWQPQD